MREEEGSYREEIVKKRRDEGRRRRNEKRQKLQKMGRGWRGREEWKKRRDKGRKQEEGKAVGNFTEVSIQTLASLVNPGSTRLRICPQLRNHVVSG
jgi:hypothetical protein